MGFPRLARDESADVVILAGPLHGKHPITSESDVLATRAGYA
jgi:hypothetical protein